MTSLNRDARLPVLNKEDQTKTSCKHDDKRESPFAIFPLFCRNSLVCFGLFLSFSIVATANAGIVIRAPEQSDVDREVEHVKSAWRTLREGRDWRKERVRIDDASTTRWSRIIDKMTRDVDRIQKRCLDPGASRYLRKSATDVFRAAISRSSLEEDAEVARSTIIPRGETKFKSAGWSRSRNLELTGWDTVQARLDEAAEDERSNDEDSLSSQRATKTRPNACTNARNIGNDVRSVHTIVSSCSERQDANATRAALRDVGATRASIDEYLRNYIGGSRRKLPDIEEDKAEERARDIGPSANDIADMLANLNFGSRELHDDFLERTTSTDTIRQDRIVSDNMSVGDSSSELVDAKSAGASKQSSATSCEGDAFIKIGLNVLNKSVPTDKLSQMLQSEYLRKDMLL